MKKSLLITVSAAISILAIGQQPSGPAHRTDHIVKAPSMLDSRGLKTNIDDWYVYADEVASASSGNTYFTILFPDSTVLMEYTNGYFPTNWHSMGQVFDPKGALWFSKATKMDSNDAYTVDSIAIPYRYFRYQNAAADTLLIQVYTHDRLLDYSLTSNQRTFKTADYEYTTKRGVNFTQEIVELLDNNDTASATAYIELALGITVNPGEVIAVALTYLPGNPYSPGDTIYSSTATVLNKINRFDQYYHSDPGQLYADGYFNSGLLVPKEVRYNTGTSWDGLFIAGIAYTDYINHYLYYKVKAGNVGLEEGRAVGFTVKQNTPNPFSSVTTIDYVIEQASEVSIEVFDITGKSVMAVREGYKVAGSHRVSLDGSSLKSGVYYYTFRSEHGQITKKMLIQH